MNQQASGKEASEIADTTRQSELIAALANDIACLKGRTPEELAEYWCILNRWKWPEQIPNPEPIPIVTKPKYRYGETPRRGAIMSHIKTLVAHKLISRTWNKDTMTDEEHSAWYAKAFGG